VIDAAFRWRIGWANVSDLSAVKKSRLARILAESQKTSQAEAAEMLDRVVHRILRTIRGGQPAEWPGLGYFKPGAGAKVEFEDKPRRKSAPRKRP
jgi:hypothetical protein